MARILVGLGLAAAVAAVGAVWFAHGSQAAPAAPAATIQRTFVSTSGNDANPCNRTDPCRSFPVAIASTTAGGEVIALDSGGYGVFSIDKSITIAGAPGAHVAVTAFAGTGITVNVGASDTVVLRNLYLTGLGADDGISFEGGGRLFVESVVASGFNLDGLRATAADAQLFVRDSVFRNNGSVGVEVNGSLRAQIDDTRSDLNHWGFVVFHGHAGVSGSIATHNVVGFWFALNARAAVSDCVSDASTASGVQVQDEGTRLMLSEVVISNSLGAGLYLVGGTPRARIGGSTVTENTGGGLYVEDGTLESYGDNLVNGNGPNIGTITPVGKT